MKARIGALACLSGLAAAAWPLAAMAADNAPREWQIDLPAAATSIMQSLRHFHTLLLVIITGIVLLVLGLLIWVMIRYRETANPVPSKTSHNTMIEVIWTVVPVLILIGIAIPSFRLLFDQYEFPKPDVIVKVTGKQWNWSYEYPQDRIAFDSFMIDAKDLKPGQIRTLSVDNEMVVPVNKVVQVLIAASDVTHQWTVQGFGVRADAIPGRVNRTWFQATETGTFYGQCSQLCGNGHPYMPIVVRVVNEQEYKDWVANKQKTASTQGNQVASAQ